MSSSLLFICIVSLLASVCLADTITWVGPPNAHTFWRDASNWDLGRLPTINDDVILSTNTSNDFIIWILGANNTDYQAYAKSVTCVNGHMSLLISQGLTIGSGGVQWSPQCTGNFQMSGGRVNCSNCNQDWNFYGRAYGFFWKEGSIDVSVTINMWVSAFITSFFDEAGNTLPSPKYLNALIQTHDFVGVQPAVVWLQNIATPNSATDGSGLAFGPNGKIVGTTWYSGIVKLFLAQGVTPTAPMIQDIAFFFTGSQGNPYVSDLQIAVPMSLYSFSSTSGITVNNKINISAAVTWNSVNTAATVGVFTNPWSTGQLTLTNDSSSAPMSLNALQAVGTSIIISGEPTVTIQSLTCDGCTLDTSDGCSSVSISTLSYGTRANTSEYNIGCDVRVTDESVLNAEYVGLSASGTLSVNAMDVATLGIYDGGVVNIRSGNQTTIGDCYFEEGGVYSNGMANVYSTSLTAVGYPGENRVISSIAWTTKYGADQGNYYNLQNGATLTGGN